MKRITKRQICSNISARINNKIHRKDIENIVSILLDEMLDELSVVGKLNLKNFCSLKIEKSTPRKYYDITKQRFATSKGSKLLKVRLSDRLRSKIISHLDVIKTFT